MSADTIAALATPPGSGGVAIVRLSGERSKEILLGAFRPAGNRSLASHRLVFGHVIDREGAPIDEAMAVFMRAPRSYTREDVAELQVHGSSAVVEAVIARLIELGARPAEPGEFTRRAFVNGRIDLSQAEAVMSLVSSSSQAARRASLRQLEGGVSRFVGQVTAQLTALLASVEASVDYPEEIDEPVAAAEVLSGAKELIALIERAADEKRAKLIRSGFCVALVGRPNVGKSSLLNALTRADRAIVTEIAGTTRDVLSERMLVGGVWVELWDTAGQRDSLDPVEKIGVERARDAQNRADMVLAVIDGSVPLTPDDHQILSALDHRSVVVVNKSDLPAAQLSLPGQWPTVAVSCRDGRGIDALHALIAGGVEGSGDALLTEGRHISRARSALSALGRVVQSVESGMPLDACAVDLWEALDEMSQITGQNASEEVITEIFSRFCVGK